MFGRLLFSGIARMVNQHEDPTPTKWGPHQHDVLYDLDMQHVLSRMGFPYAILTTSGELSHRMFRFETPRGRHGHLFCGRVIYGLCSVLRTGTRLRGPR